MLAFSQQKHKDKSDRRDSAEGNNNGRPTRVYSPETEGETEDERQTAAASLNSSSLCCGASHIKGGHTATKTSICKCVVESRSCKMCLHGEMSDALCFRKAMAVEKIALFVTLPRFLSIISVGWRVGRILGGQGGLQCSRFERSAKFYTACI